MTNSNPPDPTVITATTLRIKTRDVLEGAKFSGEHFIVETFNKPMAAIIGIEDYWKLMKKPLSDQDDP